ncbi:MAG: hypothetical protein AAGG72_08990, partial [Pseudomonadota bacterium]
NRLAGTEIPPITDPVGGSESFERLMSWLGATTETEPQNALQRYARSIGRETGALAVPGGMGLAAASRMAPTATGLMASAIGAGIGSQAASDATGGNATAETLGALAGGLSPIAASRAIRPKAPTLDGLRRTAEAGYSAVEQSTARLRPEAAAKLADNLEGVFGKRSLAARKLNPKASVAADSIAADLRENPPTIQELEEARRWIGRNVAASSDASERALGVAMKKQIDDYLEALKPEDLIGTNDARSVVAQLKSAREATSRLKRAEIFEADDVGLIDQGLRRAATTGTGGNEINAIRQNIARVLKNPKLIRGFKSHELQAMRDIADGRPTQNALRLLSRLAPSTGTLPLGGFGAAAAGAGATGNPLWLLPSAVGEGARMTGDAMLRRQVRNLGDVIRNGAPLRRQPSATANGILAALLASQTAQAASGP